MITMEIQLLREEISELEALINNFPDDMKGAYVDAYVARLEMLHAELAILENKV